MSGQFHSSTPKKRAGEPQSITYKAAQKQGFEHSLTRFMQLLDKAIDTLDRAMDGTATRSSQVRAAQFLIEQSIELFVAKEFEARLQDLEEQLNAHDKRR